MQTWDPDPRKNELIENKRTELKILFANKVDRWLDKYHMKCPMRDLCISARLVLSGKIKRLSMKMLEPLERMLQERFSIKTACAVDLCSDDELSVVEDRRHPIQEKESPPVKSLNLRISPEIIIDDSEDDIQVVPDLPSPLDNILPASRLDIPEPQVNVSVCSSGPHATLQVPLPNSNMLPLESLDLFVPEASIPAASSATQQRRKSVNSRPSSSKDLPSIAEYKIKTPILKPPSIYTKTGVEAPRVRHIISVPYKNPVRRTQAAYDPREESKKLADIKEKIYAKNYLSIDVTHKIEMQKMEEEKLAKEKEDVASETSDEDVTPLAKRRRKSTDEPKAKLRKSGENGTGGRGKDKIQPSKQNRQKTKEQAPKPEVTMPRRKSTVHTGRNSKRQPRRNPSASRSNPKKTTNKKKMVPVSTTLKKKREKSWDSSDDDYVVPSHVLDPIEAELEAMQNGTCTRRWVRETPTTAESSSNANVTGSSISCTEDPLEAMLNKSIGSKAAENDTSPIVEQSFDEDNLLVEVACDQNKNRKPPRYSRMVPKNRQAQYKGPPRKRGRPRRIAIDQVEVKEEPEFN